MNKLGSIAIVGAGAMGCRFGSQLFEAGYDVTLYDVWEEHVRTINEHGLKVRRNGTEHVVKIPARTDALPNQTYDVIFLFTKSQFSVDALQRYRALLSPESYLITLQNGIGHQELLSDCVPLERLMIGTTTYSSDLHGPGCIESGGSGMVYVTLAAKDSASSILDWVVDALNRASIHTEATQNTWIAVWEKLAFNAAINTLTAITQLNTGQVGNHPLGIELMRGIVEEVRQVAGHQGIDIQTESVMDALAQVSQPHTAGDHLPSMLQDRLKKKKTEIEAINGAVIREAKKWNVAVPYNQTVYTLIKMIEDHYSRDTKTIVEV